MYLFQKVMFSHVLVFLFVFVWDYAKMKQRISLREGRLEMLQGITDYILRALIILDKVLDFF